MEEEIMEDENTKMDMDDDHPESMDEIELGEDLGGLGDGLGDDSMLGDNLSLQGDGTNSMHDIPSAIPLVQTSSFGMIAEKTKVKNRTNAKTVECYDMQGNYVGEFPSGSSAAQALGVAQGDISLCCRGLKDNVNGYKFRFKGDPFDFQRVKRGYQIVAEDANAGKSELNTRTTRASRGEHVGMGASRTRQEDTLKYYLAPPEHKTREWKEELVSVGPFSVKKWVPQSSELNKDLQEHKSRVSEDKRRTTTSKKR